MIEAIMSNAKAFSKVVDTDLVRRIMKILKENMNDPAIANSCLRVLEKVGKTDEGLSMIHENGGIETLLQVLNNIANSDYHGPEDAEAVTRTTKILGKMAKDGEIIRLIKEAGGIDIYLKVLDSFPDNEKLARLGGKFLTRITGDSIEELIAILKESGVSPALLERTLALLASLAIDNSSSNDIVGNGGVQALLAMFQQNLSGKALESTCKAISRLAGNAKNIQGLVDNGAITQLVGALGVKQATAESKAQAIDALQKIGAHAAFVQAVVDSGAVPAVVKALVSDPENAALAAAALKFFATMQQNADFDAQSIASASGAIEAICKAMMANEDNMVIQENGTITLCSFCVSSEAETNVSAIVKAQGVTVAIKNISDYPENMELLTNSMTLLTHALLVKEGEVAVREGGGVDAVVSSVMFHPDNDQVRKAAMELVELLSSDELVQQMIKGLKKFVEGKMDQSEYAKVPVMAMCLGTLAMIPENVTRIMQFGGVPPMVDLLGMVAGMPDCPCQEEILSALCCALKEIIGNVETVEEVADPSTLLNSAITIIECHPKMEGPVAQALGLIIRILQTCPDLDLAEFSLIEAAVTAIRNNTNVNQVLNPASELLLDLCKRLGGEVANKKSGGRGAVMVVSTNAHDEQCIPALTNSMLIMEIISQHAEGKETLLKQGAVAAIFAAMEKHTNNADFISVCRRAIANLVDADAVYQTLTELSQFTADDIAAGDPAIAKCVERLGLLLLCGDFSDVIAEYNGVQLLVNILAGTEYMEEGSAKQALVSACIAAFGRAAGNASVESALPIVPMIVKALQENPTIETLQSVAALTKDEAVLKELVRLGAVEALLPLIRDGDMDPEMTQWASVALSGLAKDSEGAQRIVHGGGVHYLCEYISEQDGADIVESIKLLQNLAAHADAATLINGGVMDTISDVLFRLNGKDEVEGLTATINLINKIAATPEGAEEVLNKGIPGTVVSVINSNDAYVKSPACMTAFAEMVKTLSNSSERAGEDLTTIGAPEILIKAMNANSNSNDVVSACAKALGLIKGGGPDGLRSILEQVIPYIEAMEGGDQSVVEGFTHGMKLCGNMMLEEGAVDQDLANLLMDCLNRAIVVLRNFEPTNEQQEAMKVCLATLSRLATIDTVTIDANAAVGMCSGEFSGSALVIESACACIGSIAAVEGGINAIASHGMIANIQNAAAGKGQVGKIGATGMALQAAKAMEVIAEQALSHAVSLVGTEGGAVAIAEILRNIEDKKSLATTLDQICKTQGGLEALLDTLVALGPPDFGGDAITVEAIITAMLKQRDQNGVFVQVSSAAQIEALSGSCKFNPDSVILMESAAEHLDGINWLANAEGCFDALVKGLTSTNLIAAQMSASIFSKCIASNDSDVMAKLKEAGVANGLLMALKDPQNLQDEIFTQNALYSLRTMADTIGVAEMNIGKEGIKIIQGGMYAHSQNQYIADTCNALLAHLVQAFAGGTEALLEDRLRNLVNIHANSAMWQEVTGDDGSKYFYNSQTGESAWEQAAEHMMLATELDAIIKLVEGLDGNVADLDITCAASLVGVVGTHKQDAGIIGKIVSALSGLCTSDEANALLAQSCNVAELLAAMAFHIGDANIMEKSIDVIESMSDLDFLKESLSTYEYIQTVNSAIWTHMTVKKLVVKGTRILHLLSNDNEEVVGFEMAVQVPTTMKNAMSQHMESKEVMEECYVCLGNLFYGEESNRRVVAEACCEEILTGMKKWQENKDMCEVMLKTVGNLTADDDAIIMMVEKQATATIVTGMNLHKEDEEILRLSIMVISNFGAINDEEQDAYATSFIINEGGTLAVKEAMERMIESESIVEASMEALFNLGNDVDAAIDLAEMGVMELTMTAIQAFDYANDLLSWAIKFLSVFTHAEVTLDRFATLNGGEVLLKVMQNKMEDEQFLQDASLTLSNALVSESNRETVQGANGVTVLLQTMDLYNSNPFLVQYIIAALNRLCTNDDTSTEVAKLGMHVFMKAVHANLESTETLSLIFELFGQLAFVKDNIKLIVQHGGIKIFLQMMDVFGEQEELMCQTLNTLDNIVSADEEYAAIMIEKDGEKKIKSVLAIHPNDERVKHAGNATLLSMTAMSKVKEQEGSKISRGALFARLGSDVVDLSGDKHKNVNNSEPCPDEDPLEKYRNLLRSGSLLKCYDNGGKVSRHIFVSRDWQSIWIKDTSSTSKQAKRIYLNKMRSITKGYGPGHMKTGFGKKKSNAKENCCLYIDSPSETNKLALECASEGDRDQWFNAMSRFLEVARKWPHKVVPQ